MINLEVVKKEAHAQWTNECNEAMDRYDAIKLAAEIHRDEAIAKISKDDTGMARKIIISSYLSTIHEAYRVCEEFCIIQARRRNETVLQAELRLMDEHGRAHIEEYLNSKDLGIDSQTKSQLLDEFFPPRK
jgi:hypothetical protein